MIRPNDRLLRPVQVAVRVSTHPLEGVELLEIRRGARELSLTEALTVVRLLRERAPCSSSRRNERRKPYRATSRGSRATRTSGPCRSPTKPPRSRWRCRSCSTCARDAVRASNSHDNPYEAAR